MLSELNIAYVICEKYGTLRRSVFLLLCLLIFLSAVPCVRAASDYVEQLIERSDREELHKHEYWHLLLHYQRGLFSSKSLIDDPKFFLSKTGGSDPKAELHAMLRSLAKSDACNATNHPASRFVARYSWLKEQLDIDAAKLDIPKETAFGDAYEKLHLRSATLVFPSCFINNPASMFGHTLIVFDSGKQNRLLSTSVSYAGHADGGSTTMFILGSFIGTFPGYYSIIPYYDKVEEYGDVSDRDIWEYELALTEEELARMLMHTWELQGIRSDYYFLDENCAFNLLWLIDAARPSLDLMKDFSGCVTPIDTVKAVCEKGLLRKVTYRPSKVSTVNYLKKTLSSEECRMALDVADGRLTPETVLAQAADEERRVMILDLASQYVQYKYTKRIITPKEYRKVFFAALKARSRISKASDDVYTVPEPCRPDLGHDGNRLSLGMGVQNDNVFSTLRWRPVYHALEDNDDGYDMGAQVEFMAVDVRYYSQDEEWQLESMDVLDIYSISARDSFFSPKSWRAATGIARRAFSEDESSLVYEVDLGRGHGYELGAVGLFYAMVDIIIELGLDYDDSYMFGAGCSVGAVLSPASNWKVFLEGRGSYHAGRSQRFESYTASLIQDFRVTRNNSIALGLSHRENDGYSRTDASLTWNLYY